MNFEQFRNYVWGMYGNNTISRGWELYKKSQHALWMARALRAEEHTFIHAPKRDKWEWVERKCREYADRFKEGE